MKIGFIGVGKMGVGMVLNLLDAGYEVGFFCQNPKCDCERSIEPRRLAGSFIGGTRTIKRNHHTEPEQYKSSEVDPMSRPILTFFKLHFLGILCQIWR